MQNGKSEAPILILGGTNFMGMATIDLLSKQYPNSQIVTVNRGKVYWKNQVYIDHPNIKHFYGDRKEHKEMGKAIKYLSNQYNICEEHKWRAVIDFSTFRWREMQSVVKNLQGKVQIYIFISSDSVYNNQQYNGKPIKQSDFSIEGAYNALKKSKIEDKYGYNKLKTEIYLNRTKHVPYVSLRLPDVIGPFDNTERYWCSLQWVGKTQQLAIELIEKDIKMPLSFVFSKDVASAISYLIKNSECVNKYKSYNIACKQNPTYKELMLKIAESRQKIQGLTSSYNLNFKTSKKDESNGMYPSTNYTCINCQLAQKQLQWKPTPLDQVIMETSKFFLKEGPSYPKEYRQMKKQFKQKISNP